MLFAFNPFVNLLHQKHDSDARHEPPVDLLNNLSVQSHHLLMAEVLQGVEARLNLRRCDQGTFHSNLAELDVSFAVGNHCEERCDADSTAWDCKNDALVRCRKGIEVNSALGSQWNSSRNGRQRDLISYF